MAETKAPPKSTQVEVKAVWKERLELDHVLTDEAFLQLLGDKYYLTFGQHRIPMTGQAQEGVVKLEIHPVSKLVLTPQALAKIRDMLNRMLPAEE